jgi:phosphate butyryltransferase
LGKKVKGGSKMIKNFEFFKEKIVDSEKKKIVLVGSEDREALISLKKAEKIGIADAILVGNKEITKKYCEELKINFEIIDSKTPESAVEIGVKLVNSGKGNILMKGLIKTSTLLKAVLNKDWGLRKNKLLSHICAMEIPGIDRLLFVADGGMVIKPNLSEKIEIIKNSVEFLNDLGYVNPNVAVISAVEVVNDAIESTIDAAILSKMGQRGQIKNCTIDGPLGIDNAINEKAAEIKKIKSKVAGKADLLIVPDINSGNFLGKSVIYLSKGTIAGVILGSRAPIVLTSRADEEKSKLNSIALAVYSTLKK